MASSVSFAKTTKHVDLPGRRFSKNSIAEIYSSAVAPWKERKKGKLTAMGDFRRSKDSPIGARREEFISWESDGRHHDTRGAFWALHFRHGLSAEEKEISLLLVVIHGGPNGPCRTRPALSMPTVTIHRTLCLAKGAWCCSAKLSRFRRIRLKKNSAPFKRAQISRR